MGCVIAATSVYGATVFYDDFSDGNLDAWTPYEATTALVENDSLVISRAGFAAIDVDGLVLEDISLRTQLRIHNWGAITGIGVLLRDSPADGYWSYITPDGECGFGTVDGTTIASADTDFDVTQEDLMVQLDAIGNQLSLWVWRPTESMPVEPLVSAEDSTIQMGGVRLWINDLNTSDRVEGAFRFVHVADAHIPEPSTLLLCIIALGVVGGSWKWGG